MKDAIIPSPTVAGPPPFVEPSSLVTVLTPQPSTTFSPDQLNFLQTIVNTPAKVQVLYFFLTHSGICLSSAQLATRLSLTQDEVRAALQALHDEGALTYCPYFGDADLCLMNSNYHTTVMKRDLQAFRDKMDQDAAAVHAVVAAQA